ncbi:MAG: hypothetical protein HUJ68_09710 [Clostridia bacterium]|nr:hypothetical protein [Clostridia bacterium]
MLGSPELRGDAWRSQNGDKNPALKDREGYKNIYISDPEFEDYYTNHVSVKNPVVDAMDSAIEGEGIHAQESINFFRTVDIKITKSSSAYTGWNAQTTKGWGNWRTYTGVGVDERIMLHLEDISKIGLSYNQNFGYAWDEVAGQGALGKVADMAKKLQNSAAMLAAQTGSSMNVDASTPMGKYQKVPYLKSIDPFKVEPSSLTFTFNIGQSGIFSGEQEVVRPIIALARIFIPYQGDDKNWYNLSAPTQAQVYQNIAKAMEGFLGQQVKEMSSIMGEMGDAIKSDFDISHPIDSIATTGSNAVTAASNMATSFLKGMYDRIDKGLKAAVESYNTSIVLRVGRYQLPPCFPTEVSWSFNFDHVDEYGFPCGGQITFGGLQSPKCGERTDIGILN